MYNLPLKSGWCICMFRIDSVMIILYSLFLVETHIFNLKLTFLTRNWLFLLETRFSYSKLTFLTRNFGKYCQQGNLVSINLREHVDSARHNDNFLSNTALHCGDLHRSFHTVNSTRGIFVQPHKPGTAGSCPAHYPRYPPPVPIGGLEVVGAVVTNGLCNRLNKSV